MYVCELCGKAHGRGQVGCESRAPKRCARHALLGCALCGPSGRGVVAATPPREHERRSVNVYDFGLSRVRAAMRELHGRELLPEEVRAWLLDAIRRRAERDAPDFDVNDVMQVLTADIADVRLRGRLYRVSGDKATCPKCGERCDIAALVCVSGFTVRLPNFSKCPVCEGGEDEEGSRRGCDACDFKGYIISSWTQTTAYAVCGLCVARDRQPTKRGSATNFTTTSRAGEEHGRRGQKARPMCPSCQQRYVSRKGKGKCTECAAEEARQDVVRMKRTMEAALRELERRGGGEA